MTVADHHPALLAVHYIRDHVRGVPSTVNVAMAIAANIDKTGRASIGIRALAKQCCMNAATVSDAVQVLQAAGHLEIDRGHRGNTYRLSTPQLALFASGEQSRGSDEHSSQRRVVVSGERSRGSGERSRGSVARSRGSGEHPSRSSSSSSTRGIESAAADGLLPHAVEALRLLDAGYVKVETRRRCAGRTDPPYQEKIRQRIRRQFLGLAEFAPLGALQLNYSSAAELVTVIERGDVHHESPIVRATRYPEAERNEPAPERVSPERVRELLAQAAEGVA